MSGNRLAAQSWGVVDLGQYNERFTLNEVTYAFTLMIRPGRRDAQLQN